MRGFLMLSMLVLAGHAVAIPADWSQTWVGEAAAVNGVDLGASTNDCATSVVLSGRDGEGYTMRMRTYTPPNGESAACGEGGATLWPMWWEEVHALDAGAGTARLGFFEEYTVPANCATGFYRYTIDIGALGIGTPFRFRYEGECNGHAFSHERAGTIDFVLMASAPASL